MSNNFLDEAEKYYNLPLEEAATKVEKFSEAIDLLDATLDNISVDNYEDANANLEKQLAKQKEIWDAQEKAQSKANKNRKSAEKNVKKKSNLNKKSGIDSDEKKTIQQIIKDNAKAIEEGRYDELKEIDLSMYKANSDGYNAAVKYNEALKAQTKAVQEADLAEQEYLKTEREVAKQKFDNVAEYYESKIGLLEHDMQDLDNKISEIETSGAKVNKQYYKEQKQTNADIKQRYEDEKKALEDYIQTIPQGTEEWYDALDKIQECEDAISDCTKTTMDLNNAINKLYFGMYEDIADDIDRVIKEQEFLQGLFDHEKSFDSETGNWTEAGLTRAGIASANLELVRGKKASNQKLLDELNEMAANNTLTSENFNFNSEEDRDKALEETLDKQLDIIKEEYYWETKLADLSKEKYQAELDALRTLIDDRLKLLDIEQDMLSYQNTLNEKVSNIDTLQRQITAYRGDSSQEGTARLQALQKQLNEAQKDLEMTEQEKAFQDQKELLENLFTEAEEIITKKMDEFYTLVNEATETANSKLGSIEGFISTVATKYGYERQEDGVYKLKDGEKSLADSIKTIVTYIEKKVGENSGTEDPNKSGETQTDTTPRGMGFHPIENPVVSGNVVSVDEILSPSTVREAMPERKQEVQVLSVDTTKTEKKSTSSTSTKTSSTSTKKSDDDGKITVGEKVKFKSGQYTASSDGTGNKGKQKLGDDVYIQKIVSGAKRPYLIGTKKGGGNLGWVSKSQLSGFSRGGVIEIADLNKQIRQNGDDVLVSAKEGERILTPVQNQLFEKFVNNGMQDLVDVLNMLQPIVDVPKIPNLTPLKDATFGDTIVTIEMNGVNDVETFSRQLESAIKTPKVQKQLRSVTTDRIGGGSRLGINAIK